MKGKRIGNGEGTVFEDKKNKRWIGQYISGTSADGKDRRGLLYTDCSGDTASGISAFL